jgi:two-component system, cell cycle sensor histidine kinase and response regulator CckA
MNALELRRLAEEEIFSRNEDSRARQPSSSTAYELDVHRVELEIQNEELRRTQIELEDAAAKYLDLFDLSPVGYLTLDAQGRILEANRTAEAMLCLPRHLLNRRPLSALMNEEDADRFALHVRRAFSLRTTERCDVRIQRPDGTSFPVLLASTVPSTKIKCLTTLVDLTEKHRQEEALRDAVERFEQLTDQLDDVYFLFQPSLQRLVYVSSAIERMLGVGARQAMNPKTKVLEWVHPDDRGRVMRAAITFSRGDPLDQEFRLVRADGAVRTVRVRAFLVPDQDRVAGLVTDVTDERMLEEDLRHAQKMEAVGALASGIAHDFNNLLMGVIGFATVALGRIDETHQAHREVKRVVDIAKRGEALTRRLLDFSRKRPVRTEPIEIDSVVAEVRPLLETMVGESIRVVVRTEAEHARVRANPGEIEQILMNLSTNARDSMVQGGLLEVITRQTSDSHVQISVRDTGTGMDEDTRRRIFEPFFTTKGVGEGTGLGLSTTFGLVQRMGGRINLETGLGVGTTFKIDLPMVPETGDIEAPSELPRGRGTVLLVEDNPFVRESVVYYLECIGYTALAAVDGEQAIEIVRNERIVIDVLLTDVMMPHQTGRDLAKEAHILRPELKVVFISAHPREELTERGRLDSDAVLLQKPFDEQRLALVLHQVIHG